jgi:hypothetical protein
MKYIKMWRQLWITSDYTKFYIDIGIKFCANICRPLRGYKIFTKHYLVQILYVFLSQVLVKEQVEQRYLLEYNTVWPVES